MNRRQLWLRWLPVGVIVAVVAAYFAFGLNHWLTVDALRAHESRLRLFAAEHAVLAPLAFIALYTAVVALSLPGAALMTIAGGFIFRLWPGTLFNIIGATLGAVILFVLARFVVSDAVRTRAGPFIARMAAGFERNAFSYLLFLRLVPLFPFWLVNLISAPAGVALAPFVAATALGIIPATFAFAFFGAGLSGAIAAQESVYQACVAGGEAGCRLDFDLQAAVTPELIGGLVVLGLIALIPAVARGYGAMRRGTKAPSRNEGSVVSKQ
jgi:uncharacterized membrane protein YdjX (TVP38/TMEM64 family)